MLKNGPWKFSEESEKNTTFLKSQSLEVVMLRGFQQLLREYRIRLIFEKSANNDITSNPSKHSWKQFHSNLVTLNRCCIQVHSYICQNSWALQASSLSILGSRLFCFNPSCVLNEFTMACFTKIKTKQKINYGIYCYRCLYNRLK